MKVRDARRVEGLTSEAAQGVPCKFGAGYQF